MGRLPTRISTGSDRGAAAVEFGLILPLLLIIVFGIVQFGIAYNAQLALSAGAREGVRTLAINTSSDAVARTKSAAAPLSPGAITVVTTACPIPSNPTAKAKVSATYPYNASFNLAYSAFRALMGMFGPTIPASITLTGVGEMRCLG